MDMAAIAHSLHGDAREYHSAVSRASPVTARNRTIMARLPRLALQAPFTSGVNRHAPRLTHAHLTGLELVMGHHVKIVCLSVGLLVALSGLFSVSFARAPVKPVKTTTVMALTLQSAQSSVATGATFRAIAIGY
jgi:Tfp pilus assembly protein FimV